MAYQSHAERTAVAGPGDAGLARAPIPGLAFREIRADFRNVRACGIATERAARPVAADDDGRRTDPAGQRTSHGIDPVAEPAAGAYDAVVLALALHRSVEMGNAAIRDLGKPGAVLFDVTGATGKAGSDLRL